MKKLSGLIFLLLSMGLFSFEELQGIGVRKCGTATKKGFTHPQFPEYKMDCETFEHIIGSWYKDKENVYFYRDQNNKYIGFEVIDGVYPKKVKAVGESAEIYYISDGKTIYIQKGFYPAGIIENVNLKKFKILENGYSRDDKKIYYLWEELDKPDIKTFKVYTGVIKTKFEYNAEDKDKYYRDGKAVMLK